MRRINAATVLATSLFLMAGVLSALPSSAMTPSLATMPSSAGLATAHVQSVGRVHTGGHRVGKPKPAPSHYTPPRGVRFNNPLGGRDSRRHILGHLIRTIDSVPGREKIRVASWNVRSADVVNSLIAAHNRGVSVRVVMDRLNANKSNPNSDVTRLIRALKRHEGNRKKSMLSNVVRCVSACRARAGIAHVKFYLFSRAGKAEDVVMYGSNNATDLAAYAQWNDLFTMRGKAAMYDEFFHVFNQMRRDRPVKQAYLTYEHGDYTSYFYPYRGKGTDHDPLLEVLNDIVCAGATDGTGTNGKTKIRIAQTSMHGERGKAIANRLREMWQRGCDIKIVYAVFGNGVLSVLRHTTRGPVPIKQIAQDFNLDGIYDRYLHMKSMAVSGRYRDRTNANVTWNGTANFTSVALASDEVVMRIFGGRVREQYSRWVDYLFTHPPRFTGKQAVLARFAMRRTVAAGVDPYSKMQLD